MSFDTYISVMGLNIRYQQRGDTGPDILLVHGISSSIEDWSANLGPLSDTARVWAVDLPGCGMSEARADFDYSLENQSRFLAAFMEAVGLDRAHVVGHSLGGRLTLSLARIAPERVASITLVAPAGIGFDTNIMFRLSTLPGLGELLTYPNPMGTRMLMRDAIHDDSLVTSDMIAERVAFGKRPGNHRAFLKTLRGFVGLSGFRRAAISDIHGWLHELRQPLHSIWGENDTFISPRHAAFVTERLPEAGVTVYPACGHFPQLEHKDRFNAELSAFVQAQDAKLSEPA
ncbi:alpha/beta fold hydrolase [Sulfitobacter sp. D7]|uniref:alpha/beta fold hydrolase n=1 Tax=Sulfitobacter sp. D7 TaxID=1968541 RepID=UPI000E779F40|nr:alpha/beta fold hydrolase [Sulfitobacter sp. D7]AYE88238.1 hypothetical protein B5M07_18665 [Sulfitobacter sp. D7]